MQPIRAVRKRTRSTSTNTLSVVALLQETVDTTNRELETSLGGTGLRLRVTTCTSGLASGLASFSLSRHVD